MALKETDKIFKQELEHLQKVPEKFNWEKEDAWKRFNKKNNKRFIYKLSYLVAASVIIFFVAFSIISVKNTCSIEAKSNYQLEFEELQKRKKLKEIEMRLSGKTVYTNYCMNCEGLLPTKSKFQKPIDIFQN